MPPARIMRELPRIRLERGTRRVAGMAEFFGRPHELELVRGALARARRERRPTAVVVDGEPGVGKSRLIDEAARDVRADRVAVSAYEPEMRLPFSLGHDLTRALARSSHAAGQILDSIIAPEPGGPRPDWTSVFEAAHRAAGVGDSLLITIDDDSVAAIAANAAQDRAFPRMVHRCRECRSDAEVERFLKSVAPRG